MQQESPESEVKLLEEHTCKSCGNKFHGSYCNQCGEKVLGTSDRTFRTFIASLLAFTDNKFLKAVKLIIIKPGFLSKEFAEGRRVNYMRPWQMFFVLNLIYFLFPALLQLFNISLRTQMTLRMHSPLVRALVYSKIGRDKLALQGFELMYNQKSTSLARLLIVVFVVVAALPMLVIYRKRNRFFTDHLTLSVELTCFNLAMNAILLSIFLMALNKLLHWTHLGWEKYLNDFTLTLVFVLTNAYFLFGAGRTFYNQKGKRLLIKVAIGMLGLFIALEGYRLILFLITFWSL